MQLFTPYENEFDAFLKRFLPQSGTFAKSARYALFSGGKRLRPWCVFTVLETYHIPFQKALPLAAALEFVHTYSLIHDDLPCMDNDDFRRGRPTLHMQFDEATALLTGNLLLTLAFEILNNKRLTLLFSEACGEKGLLGGQLEDLDGNTSIESLFSKKTGALFRLALEGGAIVASCDDDDVLKWRECGAALGNLYQVADDFQDGDSSYSLEELISLGEKSYHTLFTFFKEKPSHPLFQFANLLKDAYASFSTIY
jgi:geranylgeranyl pyrophosphate synthase